MQHEDPGKPMSPRAGRGRPPTARLSSLRRGETLFGMKTMGVWLAVVLLLAVGATCGGVVQDENDDCENRGMDGTCTEPGTGGGGGTGGGSTVNSGLVGDPCTADSQCIGGLCLDDETFEALTEGYQTANIPDGYCSELACAKNQGEEACGPGAYCFDLEPYVDTAFTACFALCDSVADCRDGYLCTDISNSTLYPPLPFKACFAPDFLCLLVADANVCPAGAGGT